MTDAELRDELVTLLVAGHETTATALSWALERLARHPDARGLRSGDEPYVDAVIKETLRLRPVLPIVLRRLKAPMEIGGCELPEGVERRAVIYLLHRRRTSTRTRWRSARSASSRARRHLHLDPVRRRSAPLPGASFAQFEMAAVLRVLARRCERLEPDALVPERTSRAVDHAGAP